MDTENDTVHPCGCVTTEDGLFLSYCEWSTMIWESWMGMDRRMNRSEATALLDQYNEHLSQIWQALDPLNADQ